MLRAMRAKTAPCEEAPCAGGSPASHGGDGCRDGDGEPVNAAFSRGSRSCAESRAPRALPLVETTVDRLEIFRGTALLTIRVACRPERLRGRRMIELPGHRLGHGRGVADGHQCTDAPIL